MDAGKRRRAPDSGSFSVAKRKRAEVDGSPTKSTSQQAGAGASAAEGGDHAISRISRAAASVASGVPADERSSIELHADYSFPVIEGDHAETPREAYQHVAPLLKRLAKRLDKPIAELAIYDPFYCRGAMKAHLHALGFENVYNENEDFYRVVREGRVPSFDVLLTNPPFSGDHIPALLDFVVASGKPWLLLLPQFVSRKAYFLSYLSHLTPADVRPVYCGPTEHPYDFHGVIVAPGGVPRPVNTGYFQCIWFVNVGEPHTRVVDAWKKLDSSSRTSSGGCSAAVLSCHIADIPTLVRAPRLTPAERRWRKKCVQAGIPPTSAASAGSSGSSERGVSSAPQLTRTPKGTRARDARSGTKAGSGGRH